MDLLSLSLEVSLTLPLPIWTVDALPRSAGRPYVRGAFGFATPLLIVGSINYLTLRSSGISPPPVVSLPAFVVGHLGLPPRSDEAAPSVPFALPALVVDVLNVELEAKGDWNLSDIPLYGVIDIGSSL